MSLIIQEALARLQTVSNKPLSDYKNALTREICTITESSLAYLASYDSNKRILTMIAWSISAMINCGMIEKPIVYPLEDTGLWGDAIRERKAVITNDYPNLQKNTKKGYPPGHVHLKKHLNLPIIENDKIVLVVGIANRTADYTMEDAQLLEQFMLEIWKTLKTKL